MLKNYFVIAWRSLLRNRIYSFINIFGLSIGVSCCLLLALYIKDEFSYDQHHNRLSDLYRVITIFENDREHAMGTASPPIAGALQSAIPEVEQAARLVTPPGSSQNLIRYKDKLFYEGGGAIADSTVFNLFTYEFLEGNPQHALTDAQSVIITDKLAHRLFGDQPALDQTISIQGVGTGDFTVTGVIKDNAKTSQPINFIISMNSKGGMADYINSEGVSQAWVGQNFVPTFVRLHPNHNVTEVEAKMNEVLQKFAGEELKATGRKKSLALEPLKDIYLYSTVGQSPRITYIYIIGTIAVFILLIASINFINLSTARAAKRSTEIGVRKVMGAFRTVLIGQILGEVMMIVLISIGLSVMIVQIVLPVFNNLSGKEILLNSTTAIYFSGALILLTLVTGILAGSYPAFYISSFQPAQALKGRYELNNTSGWLRKGLVVFQFMVSISLVCATLVINDQLHYIQNKNLGFNAEAKIVIPLRIEKAASKYEVIKNELLQNSSVIAATAGNYMPGSPVYSDARVFVEGDARKEAMNVQHNYVDFGYMQQLGIKLIAGRDFVNNRATESISKVIVNRATARSYGLEPDAMVGKKLIYERDPSVSMEVIGVMEDFHQASMRETIQPLMLGIAPNPGDYGLMLVRVKPENLQKTLNQIEVTWKQTVEGTPFEYSFLDEDVKKQYEADVKISQIVNWSTTLAMLISCMGLYGLSTFMAERRFKEIGIRKVLGASVGQIVGLMSKEFVRLVLLAIIISIPLAWYVMNEWLSGFAYHISINAMIFINASIAALTIALLTVSFESIRAGRMDPVKSLRDD